MSLRSVIENVLQSRKPTARELNAVAKALQDAGYGIKKYDEAALKQAADAVLQAYRRTNAVVSAHSVLAHNAVPANEVDDTSALPTSLKPIVNKIYANSKEDLEIKEHDVGCSLANGLPVRLNVKSMVVTPFKLED